MKKFTLFLMVLCIGAMAMAQTKYAKVPLRAVPVKAIKEQMMPSQSVNPVSNSKSTIEDVIGNSVYDMQTNASIDPRLTIHSDGTMGGTWTRGISGSDRGTGYNYYDGSAWGPAPSSRIENEKTGWPSYAPLGATGEIVVAHLNDGLKISTRSVKGQGTWTQTTLMGPVGATDISWPRIITSGPDHNYIHMIVSTYSVYQGLNLALLYYRSLNGGETWDKSAVILPQMTSTDYDGFNGDEYAWGTPHGDTIYFAVSGPWIDTFIMQSNDNGDTWTKIPILSNANKKLPSGTTDVPPFTNSDGSVAVEMDHSGVFHVAFGIGGGYMAATTKYIYVNRNGLVYWNSTMPMLQDSLDLDTLDAHGQLLGYVSDGPNPGDTIVGAPSYRVGLSSFPQITIDDWNNIYATWSAVTPGSPSPDPFNYRHLWYRPKFSNHTTWSDMVDLNEGVFYMFQEYVYPALAKQMKNGHLHVIYQTSSQPGSNIVDTSIPQHDVNIEYREIDPALYFASGIANSVEKGNRVSQNYPNPVKDITSFKVNLEKSANVTLEVSNIMGQKIMTLDKGFVNAGQHTFTLDGTNLIPGVYFYTVIMNSEKITKRMIVE
ncbi:MAG: T9SS type A sorting domain-containing protein [Bacteroidales bacterium]|nr:T9SS type A sorting domain-containing protein [Bacteroidales bacterium]